jgi:4-coumarate--CoA ligase
VFCPEVEKYDFSSLQTVLTGAAPLGLPVLRAFRERMLSRGYDIAVLSGKYSKLISSILSDLIKAYGLTEASPSVAYMSREWWDRKFGSVGQLFPSLEARLVSDDEGTDAQEGGPGELWIRGSSVMKVRFHRIWLSWLLSKLAQGYINNVAATRDTITGDGWLKTGDIAVIDSDGFLSIVDRKKELIKYKVIIIVLDS